MTTLADIEAMRVGARNAIRTCMHVGPRDHVVVIGDRQSLPIARLLVEEATTVGATAEVLQLESFGKRPLRRFPPGLKNALLRLRPTVTFYTAASLKGEVTFRIALLRFLEKELHTRHAHMVGITPQMMREGMAVDYRQIAKVTMAVYECVRTAREIRVTSPEGTDLVARFHPSYRWIPSPGIYSRQGEWGNLPDGEVYTCPLRVDGTFVARVLGDYFSEKYGYLNEPLVVTVQEGRLVDVQGPQPLRDEFVTYVHEAPNGSRVGEFAIGTNIGLKHLIGNLLQDEKFPGVHIAFGDPYGHATGADWQSPVHVDMVAVKTTIEVDGETIMREGEFDVDVLSRYMS